MGIFFRAGKKHWNSKMISSPNLKVVYYKATVSENRLKLRVPLPNEQSPNHVLPPFQFVGRFGRLRSCRCFATTYPIRHRPHRPPATPSLMSSISGSDTSSASRIEGESLSGAGTWIWCWARIHRPLHRRPIPPDLCPCRADLSHGRFTVDSVGEGRSNILLADLTCLPPIYCTL
jgi:hypothetical protein